MALIDQSLLLADGQDFNADTNLDSIDTRVRSDIGLGRTLYFVVLATKNFDGANGNETYKVLLGQSANADMSSAKTVVDINIPRGTTKGKRFVRHIPYGTTERYIGARVEVGGTSPSGGLSCYITCEAPAAQAAGANYPGTSKKPKIDVEFTRNAFWHGRRVRAGFVVSVDEDEIAEWMIPVDEAGNRLHEPKTRTTSIFEEVRQNTLRRKNNPLPQKKATQSISDKPAPAGESDTRTATILAAVGSLDHCDDEQWTSTGRPRLDFMRTLCGFDVTRQELNELSILRRRAADSGQ
ncbi:MAG: hypothetical protein OXB95_00285 [Rhodobacteraceae bacterium]|nr:hypothetical protein [Paracoccaceae bacterium]